MNRIIVICIGSALAALACSPLPALAQQKTAKACQDEWRANRDAYRSAKITEGAYVARCRAGETIPVPGSPAAAAPQAPAASPTTAPSTASPAAPLASRTASRPAPASTPGGYQTEAEAKAHCASELVVWANTKSKVYHFAGHRSYGKSKQGVYMCEQEATSQGYRAAKNEKRPGA